MPSTEQGTFTYSNPATIHWGAGSVAARLREEVLRLGRSRAFLIGTRSVAENPALLKSVESALGDLVVGRFAGIAQHTPVRAIGEAASAVREAQADVLISVGGGSPIDAAKAIAFTLASEVDLAEPSAMATIRGLSLSGRSVLPHIAIPTTLSVAELSYSAGFTTEGTLEKVGVRAPEIMPAIVFYDAQLAVHTPLPLWLSTGIRAVDHAVEGIISGGSHPFSDTLALEGLRRLRRGLLATRNDPDNLDARTEGQLGAWFSYALPGASMVGLSHTLGKRIGSRHGIPHGVTSCLLLPHVMRYLAPRTAAAQARIAEAFDVDIRGCTAEQAAARAADAVADLVAQLELPNHLAPYGLGDADLEEAVRPVANERLPRADLLGILRAAW